MLITPSSGLVLCSRSALVPELRPCDCAIRVDFMRIDEREADDPKKIPCNRGTDGDWYLRGVDHRVENGRIRRDFREERWAINREDIETIVRLYGPCRLCVTLEGILELEIEG